MSAVNVYAVRVISNPAKFLDPFVFEIEYEALSNLQEDLVWKVIYVGSADSNQYDQELENVPLGPVTAGTFRFQLETNPPDHTRIPPDDLLGVTVVLVTCSYRDKEFIRVGYYVNNEYLEEELRENPPEVPILDKVHRSVLADHPRVTRFAVAFDEPSPVVDEGMADVSYEGAQQADQQQQQAQDMAMDGSGDSMQQLMGGASGYGMHQQHQAPNAAYVPVM